MLPPNETYLPHNTHQVFGKTLAALTNGVSQLKKQDSFGDFLLNSFEESTQINQFFVLVIPLLNR